MGRYEVGSQQLEVFYMEMESQGVDAILGIFNDEPVPKFTGESLPG
jgi:hypothetical protein